MATNFLLSRPTLQGSMYESPDYNVMGVGLTDTVLLIGHADAKTMYDIYQVLNIQEAINFLNGDSSSPLVRALLEAYNNGCKDIWLYPVAPMSEYVDQVSDRLTIKSNLGNKTFYQKYFDRLATAYSVLKDWDLFEIILPVEAVHYDAGGVDFTTQLTNHCSTVFANTGACSLGVLGTRFTSDITTSYNALLNDSRLNLANDNGKFVMIVMGEGLITNPQLTTSYSASLATQIGTLMATTPLNRSIAGLTLAHVASITGPDLTDTQKYNLSQARINPIIRSAKAKRGLAYQTKLLTDNTLAMNGSDYWSMGQMHLVANCLNQIRDYSYKFLGTLTPNLFKEAVYNYLKGLASNGYLRDYSVVFTPENIQDSVQVDVSLSPIFGIRNIFFKVVTGPGA